MTDSLFPGAGRRLKVMVMNVQAIFGFLRGMDGRAAYRMYGMPPDTQCIAVTTSREGSDPEDLTGKIVFLLESKEFPELEANAAEIPEVKYEVLTALLPSRLEKPEAMANKTRPAPQAETKFRKLE